MLATLQQFSKAYLPPLFLESIFFEWLAGVHASSVSNGKHYKKRNNQSLS